MKQTLSIKEALKTGWTVFKDRSWFSIGAVAIIMAAATVLEFAIEQFSGGAYVLSSLISMAFQLLLGMGLTFIMLAIYDKKEVEYKEWLTPMPLFYNYAIASVLIVLAIAGGFVLFIIPGFIAMVGLMFVPYLIIDKSMKPIDAIKKSWEISKGYRFKLWVFIIVLVLLNMVGALALMVGLLVTIPVSAFATIHIYRTLLKAHE